MIVTLLMTLIGFSFINRFFNRESTIEKVALGYLIGYAIITIPIFFLTYFHIRLSFGVVATYLILLLIWSGTFLLGSRRKSNTKRFKFAFWKKLNNVQRLFYVAIAIIVTISFAINLYWPVTTWDAVTLYDFRAKLFLNGGLLLDLFDHLQRDPTQLSYYYSYPPISSIAHTVSYFLGRLYVMPLYSMFYLSLILLFFANVAKRTSLTMSLFLTFFLTTNYTIFFHSTIAYTNLPYVAYIMAFFFSLLNYIETKKLKYFLLALFFSMVSISMRILEPFYAIIGIVLLFQWKKNRRFVLDYFILVAGSFIFKKILSLHFTRDVLILTGKSIPLQVISKKAVLLSFFDLPRIWEVISYLFRSLHNFHFYFLIFIATLLIFWRSSKKILAIPAIVILSVGILIPGTLMLSTYYDGWNLIGDSVNRLMIFLYPMILYFIANIPEVENSLRIFTSNIFKKRRK